MGNRESSSLPSFLLKNSNEIITKVQTMVTRRDSPEIIDAFAAESSSNNSDAGEQQPELEVYEVEKIVSHRKKAGKTQYLLKWKGFPAAHNTWETAEGLSCEELLAEYWRLVNGQDEEEEPVEEKSSEPSVKKRKIVQTSKNSNDKEVDDDRSLRATRQSPAPSSKLPISRASVGAKLRATTASPSNSTISVRDAASTPTPKNNGEASKAALKPYAKLKSYSGKPFDSEWRPSAGNKDWESDVKKVVTMETKENVLFVFVEWKNGQLSKLPVADAYSHFPQQMLKFYEQHLTFRLV